MEVLSGEIRRGDGKAPPPFGGGGGTISSREWYLLKEPNQSIEKTACLALKAIALTFTVARNSFYNAEDLTGALVQTCVKNESAERCSGPSSDTLLRRLHRIDEPSFSQVWKRINRKLLGKLGLRRRPLMALDFRTLPYYGADQPSLVGDSRLPGTRLGVRFAMLSAVEGGRTFVLGVRQVTPFHSKVRVIREMLGRAPLRPRMLLLDREFYAVDVILALKSVKTHFLIAAKRTAPIKRLCKLFERGEIPPVADYVVRTSGSSVPVKLIFIRRKTKRGWGTHVFVSDLPIDPERASELYRCRWRIETNNREIKKFLARTTTTDMKIRRIYYSLAALLYNLWIVLRGMLGVLRAHEFKRRLDIHPTSPAIVRADDPPPLR